MAVDCGGVAATIIGHTARAARIRYRGQPVRASGVGIALGPCLHAPHIHRRKLQTVIGVTAILYDPTRGLGDLRDPVRKVEGIGYLRRCARADRPLLRCGQPAALSNA